MIPEFYYRKYRGREYTPIIVGVFECAGMGLTIINAILVNRTRFVERSSR